MFITEDKIKNISGVLESPSALATPARKLYKNVHGIPRKMINM